MDIKELLAKCEELELKEDGIDNVVTGLASLIADDDEWDELGEYIINTSRMYDKFCQPAMKKIKAGKGDEIDWRKIAIEGARMYAREIEPLHLDGDGYKKTAEYLKDYYTNLAGNGKNEELEEKPAEMEKAEYKEIDIKEPEVEKLKEEKDLAETPAEMEQAEYKDMKIEKPEVEPLKEEVAEKIAFKLGDADVEVSNDTKEEFTADEIKEVIEKENPHIFFNDADSYHYIMDFSFEKNGKKYWIESKNIEGDFSKFELNIYEGFNESVAGSLIKELNLLESKEVGNIIPAEMEKAEYGKVKPIKPEVDENGKKAEKELKEGIEDKTVNFMNKPLHYEFFNKRSDGGFVTLEVGKGELKDNDEDCYILVGYSANTNQFRFTVIYEDSEKNCDIMDSFLKDDISKADLENLKNAIYDEYNVNEDLDDEKEPTKVTVKVSDVEWDTDDEEVDLPKEFTLTVDHYDDTDLDDEVSDAITDKYGFCHFGFNYIVDGQGVNEEYINPTIFYSVERLVEGGNPDNIQDFDRIDQFDTFEQADDYIKRHIIDEETGLAIISSIYTYDNVTGTPDEDLNSLKIEKFVPANKPMGETRADKIRKGAYKRVKHESLTKDEYQVIVRNVYGENAIIKNSSNLANAKKIRDDLKSRLKSSPIYILKDGKIIDESLNEATETDINRMIEKVYGKVGNKKDEYFLQGTTIYQRMEDNGGVKRILDASTKGKLYDLLCELKAYKNFLIDAGKMEESLNEEGAGDFKYQIGDMIKMTRKAQAEGRRLFGADFKVIKGEVIDRFNGGIDMPNVYTVKMADGSEESVAESLVEFWGTKRKKESVGESFKNPIESIHTGRNIYIKLNPEFENISLSELFKIIELGGTEETNSFWRTVIREKRGHITIKRNENESNELIFYPNTWKDKNFKIKTVAGVPFEDTFHAYGVNKKTNQVESLIESKNDELKNAFTGDILSLKDGSTCTVLSTEYSKDRDVKRFKVRLEDGTKKYISRSDVSGLIKDHFEDKTVNFMNKKLKYEVISSKENKNLFIIYVGEGQLEHNGEPYFIHCSYDKIHKQFYFYVQYQDGNGSDLEDWILRDEVSEADINNLKNAVYDELNGKNIDESINEEEKTYYLYAGYYELYLTDHKLTPPYMYQAENTDLNQLINDNISEIDDEGEWINPDAAFSTDSATICFDKNIIDELNKTDLFGGEIDMYHDALSDAEFNGEDEDKVKEDYHIYDLSKYYADKNESINEVSLETAVDSNDKRQYNSLKAELKAKASGEETDEKEAEKLADKATKSNELLKRWKKAKGIKESAEIVVAKFDEGLHEIVKCDKGYFNRYNIKDGKARFTTQCVESLPTALGALKKRFPNASEDINVNESLNEEFKSFKGYKFRGIVNSKTGEIIYSKLSPKGRVLQADIKMNVNDKEDFNNKEIIQAAKKAIN